MADNGSRAHLKAVDVRHSDTQESWVPTNESTATLSRSHPKVKAQFEGKEKKAREEQAVAASLLARSQSVEGHKRVDPNWRLEDPGLFDVKSFAAVRLLHDGIRLGLEDCGARAGKIGTSPTVYIMLKSAFEQLVRSLNVLDAIEAVLYPSLGVSGISNAGIKHMAEHLLEDIIKGSGGNHAVGVELQRSIPEFSQDLEELLREKEAEVMPATAKLANAEITSLVKAAFSSLSADDVSWQAAYVGKWLDKKRPFGNVRMFIAAVQAVTAGDVWAMCIPKLERAVSKETWAKTQEFLV